MSAPATRTTCPYCGVGCGVLVTQHADGSVAIKGDPEHPANFGRLCSKGTALGETLGLEGRLLHPRINGLRASWDDAIDLVATRFSESIRDHGPDSVAFYVSGQLLTEDYYVANKLMKGYIGSANIDTNSRLCMASSVAGHRRAFGSDTVPGNYEDLELADLVVLVGSNLAWCHPVLFQRLMAAREKRGTKIVVIDPRRTVTADAADLHLMLAPDSDVALFAGLESYIIENGISDPAFSQHLVEAPRAGDRGTPDLAGISAQTGVSTIELTQFYALFGQTGKVVTVWSQGVNQSAQGTDKVNAILNCHLRTGRIGKPGMGPFSVTGQPNAMGGREVGGLANMLAAHMDIEDPAARDRVQRFWNAPTIASHAGLKAVDLFQAMNTGKIKALWVMGTNPAVSMPDADSVVSALRKCPFVVVSDVVYDTETAGLAHVLLPAAAWGEKDGTVTNSERRISRQRAFLSLPGEARPDWDIIAAVARRMGFSGFDYAAPSRIFAEHAALSGFENNGLRDFDISAHAEISDPDYQTLIPFQWPQGACQPPGGTRFFRDGRFFTPDRKARLVRVLPPSVAATCPQTLHLNTGRIRDQWHTMTRTGKVPRLMAQFGEPFVDINPQDADTMAISDADLVRIEARGRHAILRARLSDRQRQGEIFMPMHWSRPHANAARVNALVDPETDPISGQPALKRGACALRRLDARFYGFAATRNPIVLKALENMDYFAQSPLAAGFAVEFATSQCMDWQLLAGMLSGSNESQWLSAQSSDGSIRMAAYREDDLDFILFIGPRPVEVSRAFVVNSLGQGTDPSMRLAILAGRPPDLALDDGAIVCACRGVGRKRIERVILEGSTTLQAIGDLCGAGTECGSCRPELMGLIKQGGRPGLLPHAS